MYLENTFNQCNFVGIIAYLKLLMWIFVQKNPIYKILIPKLSKRTRTYMNDPVIKCSI